MKYICVTHVDALTGVPCFKEPTRNGPTFPKVKGLNVEWWDESNWPLTHPDQYPRFYGTCDDDADTTIAGVIQVFEDGDETTGKEVYDQMRYEEERARLPVIVSPRQFRLALLEFDLLDTVVAYIESLEEPLKSKLKIEWEYAVEIDKNAPSIQQMYVELGLTEKQLDDLFVRASEIGLVDPSQG